MMPRNISSTEAEAKYRVGDLNGVVGCIRPDQQAAWRRALSQHALWHLNAILALPVEQHVLGRAQRWMQSPSDETLDELTKLVFESGMLRPLTLPDWQPQSRSQQVRLSMPMSPGAEKIRYLLQALVAESNKEIFGNRMSFFIIELGAGQYTFTDLARASYVGAFTARPAEVYGMHNLALRGRLASDAFLAH
jgi:hypothetical protein